MKRKLKLFLGAFLTIILSFGIFYFFIPNPGVVIAYPGNVTTLVVEGDVVNTVEPPMFEDNEIMLSLNNIKEYIDKDIFYDKNLQKIIVTTKEQVIRMNVNKPDATVNITPIKLKITPKIIANTVYLPIGFLKDAYQINVNYYKENNVVVVDFKNVIKKNAIVMRKTGEIRKEKSIREPIYKKLNWHDKFYAYDEYDDWYKVRSQDGIVGYMQKKQMKIVSLTVSEQAKLDAEKFNKSLYSVDKGKLCIAWDQHDNRALDITTNPKIPTLDVVSPTWFSITDNEGNIRSIAKEDYVQKAKEKGYKVWALFSNCFSPIITNAVLNDSNKREKVIRTMLTYAKQYKLDGINIDFENMRTADKDIFTQFVREFAPILRQQGLTVSVDVISPGSTYYDRKRLAETVDYVAAMTYDQHWSNCPTSGSVAQLSWVEDKVKKMIAEEVPAEKLLLGIPFYVREWKEEKGPDGTIKVTENAAMSMVKAKQKIIENNAKVTWDEESGQYYAEYKVENATYKMWLEDDRSVNLKSSLVHKYGLAGVAVWKRGLENSTVWNVLNDSLKNKYNYYEWAEANKGKEYKF